MNKDIAQQPPSAQPETTGESTIKKSPGVLLTLFAAIMFAINSFLAYVAASIGGAVGADRIENMFGHALFLPLIVVLIFKIGKRFRNNRSQVIIFIWSSFLALMLLLGKINPGT